MAFAPYSSSKNSTFRSGNADVATKQKRLIAVIIGCLVLSVLVYVFGKPKTHPLSEQQLQSDLAHMHAGASAQPTTDTGLSPLPPH